MAALDGTTHDFIIVGGGSAGCVLADRLSADGSSVLLLEAGGSGRNPIYDLPMLAGKLFSYKQNNWFFNSEPQRHLDNRSMFFPRGKMLGGSFIFNGTQYIRGNPYDFNLWRQLGNAGWSYEDVLPYFRKSERYAGEASEFHGKAGPLVVSKPPETNVLTTAYLQACKEAGYPLNDDFNGAQQEGFGVYDFNIDGGRRMTTAKAFLRPAMKRPNLKVVTGAHVAKILMSGNEATGIEYIRGGTRHAAAARREIVLSAGSFNSPKILLLSGIGDPAHLAQHGIPVVAPLKGVGQNLQDHVNVSVAHASREPVSLAGTLRMHSLTVAMMRSVVLKSGPISRSPLEAGGFFSASQGLGAPEFQAVFIPYYPGHGLRLWAPWADKLEGHSYVVHVWPNRPESRGEVGLRSVDPLDPPKFDPNFLSAENDLIVTRSAIRETRRILGQGALDRFRGEELAPGVNVQSDAELDDYIRTSSGIGHHTCGTAKMGNDVMAVVDQTLKVHGIGRLRVADASIMPTMVSGNTNAATIMIAEKAADMMLQRH